MHLNGAEILPTVGILYAGEMGAALGTALIGAGVRDIHRQCRAALQEHLVLEPVLTRNAAFMRIAGTSQLSIFAGKDIA